MDFRRPLQCSQCALTAMTANFKGQTRPEVHIPHVFPMIVCYSSPSLLVIHIWNVQNAEISCGSPLRLFICSYLALTTMTVNFKGQTSPEARIPTFLSMIACYWSPYLLVIRTSKMLKFLIDVL